MDRTKFLKIVSTGFLGGGAALLAGCDSLDVSPKNIIKDKDVFSSKNGVKAYLASIYQVLPIEDFSYRNEEGFQRTGGDRWMEFYHQGAFTGEMVGPYGSTPQGAGGFGYWPYDHIRKVNKIINSLPENASNFSQEQVTSWVAEAKFCRAYFYYALAKRYGGVPIIKKVEQYPEQSIEELQVPRDKEVDVWNFISQDLDDAYNGMSETSEAGRANRYVAAALKSRATLHAGTVAKYGSENFVEGEARDKGFVGIPVSKAKDFFQQAWEAAKKCEGQYSLYRKKADKEQNYVDLFLDKDSPENILIKQYSQQAGNRHCWDATMSPRYMTPRLSRCYPTAEYVELFTGSELPITNNDGTPRRFDNLSDLKNEVDDPRLKATVFFPGATLRGLEFDTQRGIYEQFSGTAAAARGPNPSNQQYLHLAATPDITYKGKEVTGNCGINTSGSDATTRTGFYVRKFIDYNRPKSQSNLYQSTQSWIDLRYAEVLLNRAEAAFELGTGDKKADALTAINKVRDRAGATTYTPGTLTLDEIRDERLRELGIEKQRLWDLRRWRIADKVLDQTRYHGYYPYYIYDEDKYIFIRKLELFERVYTFPKKYYYEPMPGGPLGRNPNLFPNNPGY